MTVQGSIQFVLSDRIGDEDVSPAAVPLGLLRQFSDEVAKFLAGSRREVDALQLPVSIIDGSLILQASGLSSSLGVWADPERLRAQESLHLVDSSSRLTGPALTLQPSRLLSRREPGHGLM